jgi:predicted O-methyltransferase YrrM
MADRTERAGTGLSDRLSRLEFSGGWRAAAHRAYLAAHRTAERAGLHVVRASYDSPIPRRADLPEDIHERTSPMRGIAWDPRAQLAFAEGELGPYLREFRPRSDPGAPDGVFRLDNHTYDRVDAELLYAMLRWAKPARYVELGTGYSTLIAARALEANAGDGRPGDLRCYDPYPSPHVMARPDLGRRLERVSAQDVPEAVIAGLQAGDVLFVDTSHTVKLGGDVNRIVLDLLPLAAPGLLVHFHDIFLPCDYSAGHIAGAHFWTEQYLLQAFLSGNRDWEVVVGGQAIALEDPERLAALIPSFRPGVSPGAFWIRRRDPGSGPA